MPKELMESVLFGHEKGSFTGDIFLDEIFELQEKLLRVLQEREPLGLGDSKKLYFRVIAATNENLVQMVKNKTFRKDLYFRLKKIVLEVPPLRERKDDTPILIEFFLDKHKRNGKTKKMPSSIIQALMEHS
jgi:transcriptional regulator with PAS, ATPase and Fis domain